MRPTDLLATASTNTFRSKTRSILTILAIFVGAFTLTLTSGLGTGINGYIDDTVSAIGASNAMTVTKAQEGADAFTGSSGPVEYDPDAVSTGVPGLTVIALTPDDLSAIEQVEGVLDVQAARAIRPDYIVWNSGTRYVAQVGSLVPGQTTLLVAGAEPESDASDYQVAIPRAYVEPLGFASDAEAVGETVQIGVSDALREPHVIDATIAGVTEETLASPLGFSILLNDALADRLFETQSTGIPTDQADRYTSANVWFDSDATTEQINALKDRLADEGYTGTTVTDQLGAVTSVIDGIVLVLNGFAIGAGVAMIAGSAISSMLSAGLLSDLTGLTLIAFDPVSIITIILVMMAIAFLAGTIPAWRAAKADPVESLRYE